MNSRTNQLARKLSKLGIGPEALVGDNQPLYGFMHQCQDGMRSHYATVEAIAAHYLEELRSVQPQGSNFLGGYSYGGLVTFEMAQQLVSRGEVVALLALLEATNAEIRDCREPLKPSHALQPARKRVRSLSEHWATLESLPPTGQLVYILRGIKRLLGRVLLFTSIQRASKRTIDRIFVRMGRQIPASVRSRYPLDLYDAAVLNYRPRAYSGNMICFKTSKKPEYKVLHWASLVTREMKIYSINGDHMNLIEAPQFEIWSVRLKEEIFNAQETAISS